VWTLAPNGKGTELQLVHNGFTVLEDVAGHETGWNACVKQMEKLINATTT
jgi:hypothetical protein